MGGPRAQQGAEAGAGVRLIVTRPAAQALGWQQRLAALGMEAAVLPLITISPPADETALHAAWATLAAQALVMFVSPNAVAGFFAHRPAAMAWPAGVLAGSTGPGTSHALTQAGVPPAQQVAPPPPGPYDTESLWPLLAGLPWAGRPVLVVRGDGGRDWLARQLADAGALLRFVAAYRRGPPVLGPAEEALLDEALRRPQQHCWHFSSSEAVRHLRQARPEADWSRSQALATHPRIAEAVRQAGFASVVLVGVHPSDVVATLRR